jgi:NAD(P)-dependent dehydrogenase (short-subunit alcohol dehydrogenase family)
MGTVIGVIRELFPSKPTWGVDDIPDLSGKVFLVTGGYAGVGKETVRALLQHNARVYIAARSQAKAAESISDLKAATGHEALFLQLDLSDLQSVKESARTFAEKEKELHVLINNAGVMMPPVEQLTKDGYDLQFGTNVLGHFLFTQLLLPTLLASSTPSSPSRIVTVASTGALLTGHIDYTTLTPGPARTRLGKQGLYIQSKLANVIVAQELARRFGDRGLVSVSLNPGTLKTDLYRHSDGALLKFIQNLITHPVELGALTPLYAATHPDGASFNGQFFVPWARPGKLQSDPLDPAAGKALWEYLEAQVTKSGEPAAQVEVEVERS